MLSRASTATGANRSYDRYQRVFFIQIHVPLNIQIVIKFSDRNEIPTIDFRPSTDLRISPMCVLIV